MQRTLRRGAAVLAAAALSLALGGCLTLRMPGTRTEKLELETLIESEGLTQDKILLLPLDGTVSDSPQEAGMFSRPSMLVQVKDMLKAAEEDPTIRAVLLRVNSPGGTVTASDLIYEEIRRFKERTDRRVEAIILDVGASGAYYAAMAADKVTAHPTSVTGSIGVIGMFPELSGLTKMLGVDVRVVKSGAMKDIGSMWRGWTPEEREVVQSTIDAMYERFLDVVDAGRPNLTREEVRALADGRIYYADEALERGLIDEIGYIEDVFESMRDDVGSQAALAAYRYAEDYVGHYYARVSAPRSAGSAQAAAPGDTNLLKIDGRDALQSLRSPFHYLWMP